MAEVIGLASGIASLITIAAQLSKISYNLFSDLKNAPRSQEALLSEVLSLQGVVLQAKRSCEEAEAAKLAIKGPEALDEKSFAEFCKRLSSLEADLQPHMSRATWLLKEKQFKKHGETLRHFRDSLGALVSANTLIAASQTYRQVQSLSAESDRAKLLRWLEQTEETPRPLPSPLPGTGAWFLSSQQYQDWVRIGGSTMLWCTGAPGTGKSMLASIAIRDLSSRFEDSTVAYFFCDFAAQRQQDIATVLQSLLRQIVTTADAQFLPALVQLQAKAHQAKDVHILSDMLKAICDDMPNLFIVVDALDELQDPGSVMTLLKDVVTKGGKVLVTSRDMGSSLMNELAGAARLRIEANAEDVAKVVEVKLQDADVCANVRAMHDLVIAITEKANGIFLLARILVDELLQMTTIKKMRKALEAMPTHLTQAYDSSLKRMEGQPPERRQLARRVIAWVTHARRRLGVEELQHALALDEDDDEVDEDNIPRVDLLIKVCAGIVIVTDDNKVGMVHKTAFDFFCQHYSVGSHLEIGKTSLQYLRLRIFQEGPCKTWKDMNARLARMPFLSYAATHCADHILEDGAEEMLQDAILAILSDENFRSTAFQATQYKRRFSDEELAKEYFDSIPDGQNDLHVVAYWNLAHTLDILLRETCELDPQDSQGWTPLHWACHKGSSAAIQALVTAGASISQQDSQGWTPLSWIAFNGDVANVEYLLQNGARYFARKIYGLIALAWPMGHTSSVRYKVVTALLVHFCKERKSALTECDGSILDLADSRGDSDPFKVLLAFIEQPKINIDGRGSTGDFDVPVGNMWRATHRSESMYGMRSSFERASLLNCAIRDGKRTIMRALLELGAPVNRSASGYRSSLHWAAYKEDPRFVQDLVDAGADVTALDEYGQTPLHQAVLNGFVLTTESLISARSDVNLYRGPTAGNDEYRGGIAHYHVEQTPLMLACGLASDRCGDSEAISGRIFDPTTTPSNACASTLEMVSLLLAHGADFNAKDSENRSVMHYAVMSGQCCLVRRLLEAGATFEGQSHNGTTILHEAATSSDIDILDLVIDAKADLKAADLEGKNVFHYLALRSRHHIVPTEQLVAVVDTLLAKCGVDMLNAGCKSPWIMMKLDHGEHVSEGATPLSLAIETENWSLANVFQERGADLPHGFDTSRWLLRAVSSRSLVGVQLLLRLGALPEKVRWHWFPGLDGALSREELQACGDILKELVNAGLNINEPMDASYWDSTEDPEESTNLDTIISTAASRVDDSRFIQLLLDLGADPRIPGNNNMDSFHIAAVNMNWDTLATLLRHIATAPGASAHWAYASTRFSDEDSATSICKALQEHGEIDRVWGSKTLLQIATLKNNGRLVSALLSSKADPNFLELAHGFTALHYAAFDGDLHIAESLIRAGANVNLATRTWQYNMTGPSGLELGDVWQGTPLHLAAMNGCLDVVRMLIANDADINARTGTTEKTKIPSQGPTALHLALSTGKFHGGGEKPALCEERLQIAELLVAKGASVETVADHLGRRAAIRFKGHEKLWDLLQTGVEKELNM